MKMWILSLSLMAFAPATFAGVKELQGSLIKNKNSIDNLLALRAHSIPNEAYAHPLASVARQMTLDASRNNNTRDDVFVGPEALAKLIKSSSVPRLEGREGEDRKEKIYALTVLNPAHLDILKKAQAELAKSDRNEEKVAQTLGRYIEFSMKAKRFITYKEAYDLSNQLAKMNSDLQDLQEAAVKLSLKEQGVIAGFQKSIEEWMKKRIVFVTVAKNGFDIKIKNDYIAYLPGARTVQAGYLNQNYAPENVANILRVELINAVAENYSRTRWDDFTIFVKKDRKDLGFFEDDHYKYKFPMKETNQVRVSVSKDLKVATISTNKFSFQTNVEYYPVSDYLISSEGKEIYNHKTSNDSNYYNQGYYVKALLDLTGMAEASVSEFYRNYGQDYFANEKNATLSVK